MYLTNQINNNLMRPFLSHPYFSQEEFSKTVYIIKKAIIESRSIRYWQNLVSKIKTMFQNRRSECKFLFFYRKVVIISVVHSKSTCQCMTRPFFWPLFNTSLTLGPNWINLLFVKDIVSFTFPLKPWEQLVQS